MICISFFPASAACTSGLRPGSGRVDLFRVKIEVDIAPIALAHRLRAVTSRAGIRHRLPAERAIEDEPYILGFKVIIVASGQVESVKANTEERFAGDPGDLAIELSLSHVLLLPAQPRAAQTPGATRTGSGELGGRPGLVMDWSRKAIKAIAI